MEEEIEIPFPCHLNPFLQQVIEGNIEWLKEFDLIDTDLSLERYLDCDFARLYCYAFPEAEYEEMKLLIDFEMFMFLYDDQFVGARGTSLEGPLGAMQHFLGILHGARTHNSADTSRLGRAFLDMLERMNCGMSNTWRQHFSWNFQRFFASYLHETENRLRRDETVGLDLYLKQRQWALGVDPSLDAIERCGHFELPTPMRSNPHILGMREDVNYFIAFTNDVDSVHKEELAGDINNCVLILQKKTGTDRAETIKNIYQMAQEAVKRFQHRHQELKNSAPYGTLADSDRESVDRYTRGMENWIIAYYKWTRETGRYAPENAERETHPWNTRELL